MSNHFPQLNTDMDEPPRTGTRPPEPREPQGGRSSVVLGTLVGVLGISVLALHGITLAIGPMDTISCRINGYDGHHAFFHEPGLMDVIIARVDEDPQITHYDNTLGDSSGLPFGDSELQEQWSVHDLTRVNWWNSAENKTHRPWVYSVTLQGNQTEAVMRIGLAELDPLTSEFENLQTTIRDILIRIADLSRTEQEVLILNLTQKAEAGPREHGSTFTLKFDASRLRLGDLYRELSEQSQGRVYRDAVGGSSVQWESASFSYSFRTHHVASLRDNQGDSRLLMRIHSDDVVYVLRGAPGDSDQPRMSDKIFKDTIENQVEQLGIEEPTLQNFAMGNRCGFTCVRCEPHHATWEL